MKTLDECLLSDDVATALTAHINVCEVIAYQDFVAASHIYERAAKEQRHMTDEERALRRELCARSRAAKEEAAQAQRELANWLHWS